MSRSRKPRTYQIPMGLPEEKFDEYEHQIELAERRKWYAEHPEETMRHRVNSAIHLLGKHDMTPVPTPPAPPWTEQQVQTILVNLAVFMGYRGEELDKLTQMGGLGNG